MIPTCAWVHATLAALAPAAEGGGFNPLDLSQGGGFLWTVVIFLVAAPFIWMVVMGPVTRALEERDGKAARAIEAAQKASSEAEHARAEVEVKLGEARAEAARLMAEARDRAQARERELLDAAKSEAQGILDAARTAIRAAQDKAIAAIRDEVVDLALAGASKVLDRHVGADDDRRLVADLVTQAKAGAAAAPGGGESGQ